MITIDPMELIGASETLRACSIEAAEIGSQLWSCSQCAMPADLQGGVDQLVMVVDRALDSVGEQLLAQAIDLTNRALIALNDSLSSTLVVATATPAPVPASESVLGGTVVIGGTSETNIGIAGWSPFEGMTIGGPLSDIGIAGWSGLEGMTIGGPTTNIGIAGWSGLDGLGGTGGAYTANIGIAGWTPPPGTAGAGVFTPGGLAGLNGQLGVQDSIAAVNTIWTSPSWSEANAAVGFTMTESQMRTLYPGSLPALNSPVFPNPG